PVGVTGLDDRAREFTLGLGRDGDVEKARPGNVDLLDPMDRGQPSAEQLGQGPRAGTGLLAQLQGDVRGVVAVLAAARTLDGDGVGYAVGQRDLTRVNGVDQRIVYRRGELFGIHTLQRIRGCVLPGVRLPGRAGDAC